MEEVVIRPLEETDLEEVLSLERISFLNPWNRDHFLHEISSSLSFPLIARLADGTCVGYIFPFLVLDEGQILNVAVHPSFRGRRIGGILVKTALEEFVKRGASFVELEVRPSNSTAISLYNRYGFVSVGRRKSYYADGEDALLMKIRI